MDVDDVVEQVLPDVVAEEVLALAHHVVQEEEPVGLLQEQHLVVGQRERRGGRCARNRRNRGSSSVWAPYVKRVLSPVRDDTRDRK